MFSELGPVSRKSRELFGPEKPVVKLRPAYSVKLVFSYVVKGIKIKITAKFRASRGLRFEDTKRIVSPEIRPKSFGTFEKQAPGRLREESQGLLLSFLTFLRPIFFLARLAFFPPPLTAPGSPRMGAIQRGDRPNVRRREPRGVEGGG